MHPFVFPLLFLSLFLSLSTACAPFPASPSSPSQPYVFLSTSSSDLPLLLANLQSLRTSNSSHPCLILSSEKPSTQLNLMAATYGARILEIPEEDQKSYLRLTQKCAKQLKSGGKAVGGENFVLFPKVTQPKEFWILHLWRLDPALYSKVVYLAPEAHLMTSADELFDLQADLAAPPDFFIPSVFNPAVLVVRPDPGQYKAMMALGSGPGKLPVAPVTFDDLLYASVPHKMLGRLSFDGTVRGFLNYVFPRWLVGPAEARLHSRYGADFASLCTFRPSWEVIGPKKVVLFGHCVTRDPSTLPYRKELEVFTNNEFVGHYKASLQAGNEALRRS